MGFKTDLMELDWSCYRCHHIISMFTNCLVTNNSWGCRWTYCPTCALEKGYTTHNLKPFDENRKGNKVGWQSFEGVMIMGRLP